MESGNSGSNEIWVGAEMPYSHCSMAYHTAAASRPAWVSRRLSRSGRAQGVRPAIPGRTGSSRRSAPIDLHGGTAPPQVCRTGLHQDCSPCVPCLADNSICRLPVGRLPFAACCTRHAVQSSAARCPLHGFRYGARCTFRVAPRTLRGVHCGARSVVCCMLGLSWMAGGSTRAAFNVNFSARRGNIADITAKATSQTIAASLLGATCGVAPFDATCTRQRATNTHRRRKQRQGDSGAAERVHHASQSPCLPARRHGLGHHHLRRGRPKRVRRIQRLRTARGGPCVRGVQVSAAPRAPPAAIDRQSLSKPRGRERQSPGAVVSAVPGQMGQR